jgi:hypothetical protein
MPPTNVFFKKSQTYFIFRTLLDWNAAKNSPERANETSELRGRPSRAEMREICASLKACRWWMDGFEGIRRPERYSLFQKSPRQLVVVMADVLVVSLGFPRRPSAIAVGVTDVLPVLQVCPALSGEVAKELVSVALKAQVFGKFFGRLRQHDRGHRALET